MKTKSFLSIFLLAASCSIFASGAGANTLSLNPSSRDHSALPVNNLSFSVTSDVSWTVASSDPWIILGTTSGANNGSVVYSLAGNEPTAARSGSITVSGGGLTSVFQVNQSNLPTGTPPTDPPTDPPTGPPAGPFLTHPDFNSDGNADLLWRNSADGRVVSWWMDGKTIANYKTVAQVGDPNWQIVGSGNFNDNGRTDLLWKHSDGRVVAWWLNEDASIGSINVIAQILNPAWQIAGVGDLDNDGSADIIWQNSTTGIMVAWFMRNDSTVRSTKGFAKMTNPDWNLSGLGDFDQDGRTDLLWVNSATGRLQVWRMDAGEIIGYAQAGVLGDTNWKVVGTGDFNVDGKVDILWRHTDGRVVFWAMDGLSQTSTEVIGQVSNPNWLLF